MCHKGSACCLQITGIGFKFPFLPLANARFSARFSAQLLGLLKYSNTYRRAQRVLQGGKVERGEGGRGEARDSQQWRGNAAHFFLFFFRLLFRTRTRGTGRDRAEEKVLV